MMLVLLEKDYVAFLVFLIPLTITSETNAKILFVL